MHIDARPVHIAAPPEAVFARLSDFEHAPRPSAASRC